MKTFHQETKVFSQIISDNLKLNSSIYSLPDSLVLFLFSGGAELLFDKVKKHEITLPSAEKICEYIFEFKLLREKCEHLKLAK